MANEKQVELPRITIVPDRELSKTQREEIEKLQNICFSDVEGDEAEEDFYHPESAHAVIYEGDQLVGWAGIHISEVKFEKIDIKLGGFGVCTHPEFRKLGIATKLSSQAMKYLSNNNCDVAFLSVDSRNIASIKLHQKSGFILLNQNFSWKNSKGKIEHDAGGMIAPLSSQKKFNQIKKSNTTLFVGNGYW